MYESMVTWAILVVATEAATEIVVDAKITEGIRSRIRSRAHPVAEPKPVTITRRLFIFLNDLLSCGYCASVWVAGAFASLAPTLFEHSVANWLITTLLLHRSSNWFHVAYSMAKNGRVRTYDIELKLTRQ